MDHKRIKNKTTNLEPLNNSCDDLTAPGGSNDMANLSLEFTSLELQDLNDDCLREIFRSKVLDLYDLCALTDTCKRFRQIVQRVGPKKLVFRQSYKKDDHYEIKREILNEPSEYGKAEKYLHKPCNFAMIKKIFENFGPDLTSVTIWARMNVRSPCHLTDQVAVHCKDKLKHLTLLCQEFLQCQAIEMQPIFKKLESLDFYKVHLFTDANPFAGMDSLVELILTSVTNGVAILDNTFPKLERFKYSKNIVKKQRKLHERQLMNSLLPFIQRHPGLRSLEFCGIIREISAMKFCRAVVQTCKELDTVVLRCDTTRTIDCIKFLMHLKSLQSLYLEHQSFYDLKNFSALKELRYLNLSHCRLPLDLNQFDSWAHLTKIYLSTPDHFRSFDVVGVIERLTNIEELELYTYNIYILDIITVCEIVMVVCERPQSLLLKCIYDFDWEEFDAKGKLKLLQTFKFTE